MLTVTYEGVVAAVTSLWVLYKAVCFIMDRYHLGENRKRKWLMEKGMCNLMRETIRQAHQSYTTAGYIEEDELSHIEKVWNVYHSLGENGTADRWMQEIIALPRREV